MISTKQVQKLGEKKYRTESGLFVVEGRKNILELLNASFEIEVIYGTPFFINEIKTLRDQRLPLLMSVSEEELSRIGTLKSNNAGIAVVHQAITLTPEAALERARSEVVLALDNVQDPGNVGTIIRTADWFGIRSIVVSETTADFYNPKTIAATMGSFTRVSVVPLSLTEFLRDADTFCIPTFGAFLEGKPVHEIGLIDSGIIVMGSESHGIDASLTRHIKEKVTIPRHGSAESLNVAIATGIILSHIQG